MLLAQIMKCCTSLSTCTSGYNLMTFSFEQKIIHFVRSVMLDLINVETCTIIICGEKTYKYLCRCSCKMFGRSSLSVRNDVNTASMCKTDDIKILMNMF